MLGVEGSGGGKMTGVPVKSHGRSSEGRYHLPVVMIDLGVSVVRLGQVRDCSFATD